MNGHDAVLEAVRLAGGISEVARLRECSSENVRVWLRNGLVPAPHVIPLSEAGGFTVKPHHLNASIYPHEDDGVPAERRGAARAAAAQERA